MQAVAQWLFFLVLYGTLLLPVGLVVAAWRAPGGRRGQRLLAVAGGWIAVCTLAGVVRLFTEDTYYAPDHVTFWSATTAAARHDVVLLLAATAAASAALIVFRVRAPRIATPALVVLSGALLLAAAADWSGGTGRVLTIGLIAASVAAGAVLALRARERAATLFALIGGAFVPTLVMLTYEIGLGLH